MSKSLSLALAFVLLAFWVWSAIVSESPIGLVLFATSAILPVAGLLLMSALTTNPETVPVQERTQD